MSDLVNILKFIPYGRENAVEIDTLCRETGLNNRSVRNLINSARKKSVIINVQDGKGYYRPTADDVDEVKRWKKQEENRAKEVFSSLSPVRKFLQENCA